QRWIEAALLPRRNSDDGDLARLHGLAARRAARRGLRNLARKDLNMAQQGESHDDRGHDHSHAEIGASGRPGYYDMMETAGRELLVEKQLIGADEIRRQIEVLDSRTPALGAKVVARAWVDPAFRARLVANGRAACEELGISFYDDTALIVLENTDKVHNLIVC